MKRNVFCLTIFVIFLSATLSLSARKREKIEKHTYMYAVKGDDTLYMDKYANINDRRLKPVVIFLFGGGFKSGERDAPRYSEYFQFLAEKGYAVVSIDYRTALGKAKVGNDTSLTKIASLIRSAVGYAVEDLADATNFILANAEKWSIDPRLIIASGSSAGAITVLQMEYELCVGTCFGDKIPRNFRYAGIIAFAGAVFIDGAELVWLRKPAPVMLFHGDADRSVPYGKLNALGYSICGSSYLAGQFDNIGSSYYFYDVSNAGHEMADLPMKENLEEILVFLEKLAIGKERMVIRSKVSGIGKPDVKKDFGLEDYIRSNYGN